MLGVIERVFKSFLIAGIGAILWGAVPASAVLGDLNRDGRVDYDDFFLFASNFGVVGLPEQPDTVRVTVHDTVTQTQTLTVRDTVVQNVTVHDTLLRLLTNGVYWRVSEGGTLTLVEYLKFNSDGTMLRHLATYLAPWDMYHLTSGVAHQTATYQVIGCCQVHASRFTNSTGTTADFSLLEDNVLYSVSEGFGPTYNSYTFPPSPDLPNVIFRNADPITVRDTVYVSVDDRLRTDLHERNGWGWTTTWGRVNTDAKWRFLSYRQTSTGVAVSGTFSITWTNGADLDLFTYYHARFYDRNDFKIAEYYYTGPTGIKIVNYPSPLVVAIRAGGESTTSEPFTIAVPSLATANTIEVMKLSAHRWQTGE